MEDLIFPQPTEDLIKTSNKTFISYKKHFRNLSKYKRFFFIRFFIKQDYCSVLEANFRQNVNYLRFNICTYF